MGLASNKVELVSYSEEWNKLFQTEKKILKKILGKNAKKIIHIGSTAIPQMIYAKPIVDIAIGVEDYEYLEIVKDLLLKQNYYHNPTAGSFDRLFFAKGEYDNRIFNIHVEVVNGTSWKNHVMFKQILIDFPEYVHKYCDIKRKLAQHYPNDRLKYTEGKNDFIQRVLGNFDTKNGELESEINDTDMY